MSIAYIGYDLGDGETITDFAVTQKNERMMHTVFQNMTMPDTNTPGQALPTAFAYVETLGEKKLVFSSVIRDDPSICVDIQTNFKRRPTDLIKTLPDEKRRLELVKALNCAKEWPSVTEYPEINTPEMLKFKDAVCRFTDAIFTNEKYMTTLQDNISGCEKVVICLGHPTKWNELDVAIYRCMLRTGSVFGNESYLGIPCEVIVGAESRAAFLYLKDKQISEKLRRGKSILLIDIGSSTIDLTAVSADSRDRQYNSGNNYLGARGIDYLIYDWFVKEVKSGGEGELFEEMLKQNPSLPAGITFECRLAKEQVCSQDLIRGRRIFVAPFRNYPSLTKEKLIELMSSHPFIDGLDCFMKVPEDVRTEMGQDSWIKLFHDFLEREKKLINEKEISVQSVILTGSASKMPLVKEIVTEVFSEDQDTSVLLDMDPSRSISQGLTLVGPANERSSAFQNEIEEAFIEKIPTIIREDIPPLAESIGTEVEKIVSDIAKQELEKWREGEYNTINDLQKAIEEKCNNDNIQSLMNSNADYNNLILGWIRNKVGVDISQSLLDICQRYNVEGFTLDNLNIFEFDPNVNINTNMDDFSNVIAGIAGFIAAIVGVPVTATLVGAILGLLIGLGSELAITIFVFLAATPAGEVVLLAICVFGGIRIGRGGFRAAKDAIQKVIIDYNLPIWVRKAVMTDNKIESTLKKANIKDKIVKCFQEEDILKEITDNIVMELRNLINERVDSIRYEIEAQ